MNLYVTLKKLDFISTENWPKPHLHTMCDRCILLSFLAISHVKLSLELNLCIEFIILHLLNIMNRFHRIITWKFGAICPILHCVTGISGLFPSTTRDVDWWQITLFAFGILKAELSVIEKDRTRMKLGYMIYLF